MTNPFNFRIVTSHYGGPGNGSGIVQTNTYDCNSLEDAALDLGVAQSHGMSTVMLGYLNSIWRELKGSPIGFIIPARVIDSGFASLFGTFAYPRILGVTLNLELPVPIDTDMIFGRVPQYYLGMCGFGAIRGSAGAVGVGPFVIGGGTVTEPPLYGETIFINHPNHRFIPATDKTPNMFWWHLKPGVQGILNIFSEAPDNAGCITFTDTADPYTQGFNPMLTNPLAEGERDLAGNKLP